jgi:ABC-type uncharacterized transport system involved in gliding motility auxiliary subunit
MLKRILGLLGWLGVALVFTAVALRFLRPEWDWHQPFAMAGLVCTLLYVLSQWREVARSFSGREARYGTLTVASILVVLGILVAINYLASRHNKRWDLTAARQFTLSEQTTRILQGLDRPIDLRVFARSDEFDRFRQRLDEYEYVSRQVRVEYIDVERDPRRANQYEVQFSGTLVVEYDGRLERVTSTAEQDITNAIIKAVQGVEHRVYFVQGHGERSIQATDRGGLSTIVSALQGDNFETEALVLAQYQAVPDDASVLVVAGPRADFLPAEIDMLRAYLARGGKIFFLLDPPDRVDSPPLTNLIALIAEWGIEVGNNIIVDTSGMGQLLGTDVSVPIAAPPYENHPITERFNLLTAFPLARSVTSIEGGVDGRWAQELVMTSPRSWAETDIKRLLESGEVQHEPDRGDLPGPVSLAAAVSAPATDAPPPADTGDGEPPATPQTRIAVFGDSDFATNGWLGIPGNRDLFLNTVSWLAQQEDLIAIRPRDPEERRITLTADQERRIFWLTVLIIPGLILAAGVYTWWRRR